MGSSTDQGKAGVVAVLRVQVGVIFANEWLKKGGKVRVVKHWLA